MPRASNSNNNSNSNNTNTINTFEEDSNKFRETALVA
jgi:hypothetical protein